MKKNIILTCLLFTNTFCFADAYESQTNDIIDPVTQTTISNAYQVDVPGLLTFEQAQRYLRQVSPKLASEHANTVAKEMQREAVEPIDRPIVFTRASFNAYKIRKDIDLGDVKSSIANGINQKQSQVLGKLDNGLTNLGISVPNNIIPPIGNHVAGHIPDEYEFNKANQSVNLGVGVVWKLDTTGQVKAVEDLLDARTFEAKSHTRLSEDELYTTLVERYFNAQLAIIAAALRRDAYKTIEQTDYMAKRLYEEGFISLVERMEAQAALADARSEFIKARNTSRLAMKGLQRLFRTDYQISPLTPLFISTEPLNSLEYYQDIALNNHPALQIIEAKRQQAEQSRKFSNTKKYTPNVVMYGYTDVAKKPSWLAGVSATWSFTGGLDKSALVASSDAQIRQAEMSSLELKDNLLLAVEKYWHDVTNAQARFQALQTNIDLSYEVLEMRRMGLQEGVNTVLDVVQAQTLYLKASTEQAQAVNDYVQALAKLLQTCGTPLEFNNYLKNADIRLPQIYSAKSKKTK